MMVEFTGYLYVCTVGCYKTTRRAFLQNDLNFLKKIYVLILPLINQFYTVVDLFIVCFPAGCFLEKVPTT